MRQRGQVTVPNPCSRVPLPRIAQKVITPLPAGAVSALAAVIAPRYRVAVWLAAGDGLREGEALGLTVPRIDFLRRRLHIIEADAEAGAVSAEDPRQPAGRARRRC